MKVRIFLLFMIVILFPECKKPTVNTRQLKSNEDMEGLGNLRDQDFCLRFNKLSLLAEQQYLDASLDYRERETAFSLSYNQNLDQDIRQFCEALKKKAVGSGFEDLDSINPEDLNRLNLTESATSNIGDISELPLTIFEPMALVADNKTDWKEFLRILPSLTHGLGVGFAAKANIVAGASLVFEVVLHEKELGLFCAPGMQLTNNIGVAASLFAIKTLGCPSNRVYSDGFLSVGADFSFPIIPPLSVSGGGSYAFGIKVANLLNSLVESGQTPTTRDLTFLLTSLKSGLMEVPEEDYIHMAALLGMLNDIVLFYGASENLDVSKWQPQEILNSLTTATLKSEPRTPRRFIRWLKDKISPPSAAPFIYAFLEALDAGLTQCDAISIGPSVDISAGASFLSGSVGFNYYYLLSTLPLNNDALGVPGFVKFAKWLKTQYSGTSVEKTQTDDEINDLLKGYWKIVMFIKDLHDLSNEANLTEKCLIPVGQEAYKSGVKFSELLRQTNMK